MPHLLMPKTPREQLGMSRDGDRTFAVAAMVQSLFVLLFPLQWITVVNVGGFALKVAHLAVIGLSILAWIGVFSGRISWRVNPFYWMFLVILIIQLCSLVSSEDVQSGLSAIMRSFGYVVISLGIYSWFFSLEMERYSTAFSKIFPAAILVLYLLVVYSFYAAGQNFFAVVFESIYSRNPNALQYHVFYKLFNDYSLASSDMDDYSSAARHTITLSIIFLSIMAVAGLRRLTLLFRWLVYACIVAVLFFVAISMSRSAVFSIVIPLGFLLHLIVLRNPAPLIFIVMANALGIFALLLLSSSVTTWGGVTEMIQSKFVDDIVNNPRARDFGYIIDSISENPWFGAGIGTPIRGMFVRSAEVHNFFLHVWHGTGIIGAIAALALGVYLIWALIDAYRMGLRAQTFEKVCIHLIVVYALSSSLLRLSVSGSGDISLTEWCMLAIGLAFFDRLRAFSPSRPIATAMATKVATA